MSTDPIEDVIDHPPRDDAAAPPRLAEAVMTRVAAQAQPRRTRWWPLLAAAAAGLALVPGDAGGIAGIDPELLWSLAECAAGAGLVLLLARTAATEAPWTA